MSIELSKRFESFLSKVLIKAGNWDNNLNLHRRLCPDISFFQQGTDYPCQKIVNANGQQRLHHRVQHTVLKSANVERKGLGVTKVKNTTND